MVVYEDGVEAVFLTELCTLDDIRVGFVGRKKDPASELDAFLHILSRRLGLCHLEERLGSPLSVEDSMRKIDEVRGTGKARGHDRSTMFISIS
jgi:hypothetical protein